jgi:AcrR family transcriptional regulator
MSRLDVVGPTKQRILEHAAAVASTEGLELLTVGRLADDLGMSKAGVYGHFGSKERLQLDTIAFSQAIFRQHVVGPAEQARPGLLRLWAMCSAYLDYVAAKVFPGGDFFVTVANEYDTRIGPVREEIASALRTWMRRLEGLIVEAVDLGHLRPCDPVQLAFEIEALLVAGSHVSQLHDEPRALDLARAGISQRLQELRTPDAPELPAPAPPRSRRRRT